MALKLEEPLSWKDSLAALDEDSASAQAMLRDLQGNILKSHGRGHTANLFLSFDPAKAAAARAFVQSVGHEVTSAMHQFTTTELFKLAQLDSGPFVSILLTAKGYDALGKTDAMPEGEAFARGMASRDLKDPPTAQWDSHLRDNVHALIILGAETEARQQALRSRFEARIAATGNAVKLLGVEVGFPQQNADGNTLEHFGYVDGRSQPLALVEDLRREKFEFGGIDKWDPRIPLSQLLVKCPGGALDVSHGSFFVFRKLEQNVKGFKTLEAAMGKELGMGERAGASVVGRFENGTPVTLLEDEETPIQRGNAGVPNNFNYSDDKEGLRCPFGSHIRKTNPRNDLDGSKSALMARRGITYGKRTDGLNDDRLDNKPEGGVGLLFMSYQSSLEGQFEVTQRIWANNPEFVNSKTGIDPIIGQPQSPSAPPPGKPDSAAQRYPIEYGKKLSEPFHFSGFVKMRGGEYFFAPSISFLQSI